MKISRSDRLIIQKLCERYGTHAIAEAVGELDGAAPPAAKGRKPDPESNQIGIWAVTEIRKLQRPDRVSHVFSDLSNEMRKFFCPSPSTKTLSNNYNRAKKRLNRDGVFEKSAKRLFADIECNLQPEEIVYPWMMKRNEVGVMAAAKIDVHVLGWSKIRRIHQFGDHAIAIVVKAK
jgi:hypothetical protein